SMLVGQAFAGTAGQHLFAQLGRAELAEAGGFTQFIEQFAQGTEHGFTAIATQQRPAGGAAQQAVDGRQTEGRAPNLGSLTGHAGLPCRFRPGSFPERSGLPQGEPSWNTFTRSRRKLSKLAPKAVRWPGHVGTAMP